MREPALNKQPSEQFVTELVATQVSVFLQETRQSAEYIQARKITGGQDHVFSLANSELERIVKETVLKWD
jgi:hypothetical protein